MRLAKYLAQCGISSRREACRLIEAGRIHIDGRIATHTEPIHLDSNSCPVETLTLDGKPIQAQEPLTYWLFNKAIGTDCRLLESDTTSLIHLLPQSPRLYPVGRLDKDSRGLLLLTNDGELTHKLMHPSFAHSKTYHVTLDRPFDDAFISSMARGVSYKNVQTLPCKLKRLADSQFEITLTQGLNRQIRNMAKALGYRVIDLQRIAIMTLSLFAPMDKKLKEGEMRPLTEQEIQLLKQALNL
ncbi:pseudouridine synthase [Shewanella sp. A25]|nr:pseudouridine synthase [Shewanella shenzhenensis]